MDRVRQFFLHFEHAHFFFGTNSFRLELFKLSTMDTLYNRVLYSIVMASTALLALELGSFGKFAVLSVVFVVALLEWTKLCTLFFHNQSVLLQFDSEHRLTDNPIDFVCLQVYPTGLFCLGLFAWSLQGLTKVHCYQLFAVVWLTDIGAYAFGKLLQGPKLNIAISPNKTWTGLLGGLLCGPFAGLFFGLPLSMGLLLSCLAQAGDLLESKLKRWSDQKDSNVSNFYIPGHGGILDRIDGLVLSAPILYFFQKMYP